MTREQKNTLRKLIDNLEDENRCLALHQEHWPNSGYTENSRAEVFRINTEIDTILDSISTTEPDYYPAIRE